MEEQILSGRPQEETVRDSGAPERLFALKDGDAFFVCDAFGDVCGGADGFFVDDTRILSVFRLMLADLRPPLLSAAISDDNVFFTCHGTNHPLAPIGDAHVPEGVVHLERRRFLSNGRLYERLRWTNYGAALADLPVSFLFQSDFKDIFEVRGHLRPHRGKFLEPFLTNDAVEFRYRGLDGALRKAIVAFSSAPLRLSPRRADFNLRVESGARTELYLEIGTEPASSAGRRRFDEAAANAGAPMQEKLQRGAHLLTSGLLFNSWLGRSRADLALLVTDLPTGPYPYAGIPWFSTTFGRDALITAWEMLWLDPSLARGVLSFLAATQATGYSPSRDSAPGKILHEARRGEMAAQGEVPFERYYGGVDSTCLFVALAVAYADRTGDAAFIDELWPSLTAAVGWMDSFSSKNPDGLITYQRGADTGLLNQGWKDSHDSIFHADGTFPHGPIALVEVQGYAYAAYNGMARMAHRRGDELSATRWRARAEQLRHSVEARFWMEEQQFYGVAIDGEGRLCRVKASNAGHLLFVGLPSQPRGRAVARQLMSPTFSTGWGLRTLAADQAHYNPMSYHNGSVWPHDTAICGAGLRRYGEPEDVAHLLSGLFEAAVHFEMRLPELFCGFVRTGSESPVPYPVACLPQAWAAASAFGMLQACLGITINGWTGEINVATPRLPAGIRDIEIHDLGVGGEAIGLSFRDLGGLVSVLRVAGDRSAIPLIIET
jgi:glycogen debranching enzyme